METRKQLSIVIVTYNSTPLILDCLNSIYRYNDIEDELEVIIVDNNSSDYSQLQHIVESKFPSVTIIRNRLNSGYGQGNNIGIKASCGEYILIMNPDVRLKEPIFKHCITLMKEKGIVMLGMKQYVNDYKTGVSFRIDDYKIPSFIRILLTKICNRLDIFNPLKMYIVGACFFLDKSKFLDIGMFDENIFMYNEESDIRNMIIDNYGAKTILYINKFGFIHLSDNRPFNFNADKRAIESLVYYTNKYQIDTKSVLNNKKTERRLLYYYTKLFKKNKTGDLEEIRKSINYINRLSESI